MCVSFIVLVEELEMTVLLPSSINTV